VELLPQDRKTLIGMIHLGELTGQPEFAGVDALVAQALADLAALERGGIDAVLVENWKDQSRAPFVDAESAAVMGAILETVVNAAQVPVGVNVLPNDYRTALSIAAEAGARFVQLDVFSDAVLTDYTYSKAKPFEIHVDRSLVLAWRKRLDAEGVALFATVQPKHYVMLDPEQTLADSTRLAIDGGADAVVVTGHATGKAPSVGRVREVKEAAGDVPVLVGSGLDESNAVALLESCAGAIVGTSIKTPDFSAVDALSLRALVNLVNG
jgi:membrane complex biogenesis BtpA family protein